MKVVFVRSLRCIKTFLRLIDLAYAKEYETFSRKVMKVVFFRFKNKLFRLIDRACAKDNNTKFVEEGNKSRFCNV